MVYRCFSVYEVRVHFRLILSDSRYFVLMSLFFFFSSRRRHTRCLSDWSSDVCSSDLEGILCLGISGPAVFSLRLLAARRPLLCVAELAAVGAALIAAVAAHREGMVAVRSEERRVGKECRWTRWTDQLKQVDARRTAPE